MASTNRWLEHQGKTVAQQERSQSVLKDVNYKRNDGKGSSVPRKKDEDAAAATTGREESQLRAQDRTAIASQEGESLEGKSRKLKWKMSESGCVGGGTAKRKTRGAGWHGVSKRDMQKEAPKKYQEKVFEESKELEEPRAKELLELVREKDMLV